MKHKNIRGKIIYESKQTGEWKEFGREWWSITRHEDGQNTLRAHCEIEPGVVEDRSVLRDVVYTFDKNYKPIDCFNRLHQDGAFLGSGWINFTDTIVECEANNKFSGRTSQRFPLNVPPLSLGSHPVSCDILHLPRFDHSKKEKIQPQENVWMTSREHDGCSGPQLETMRFGLEYVGKEKIEVPAGEFNSHHYKFLLADSGGPRLHPTEECWCTDDFIFVKIVVGGYMNARFVLTELERSY